MGVHHMAFATKDAKATHDFYTAAMGFELVKVEVARSTSTTRRSATTGARTSRVVSVCRPA
jgi:catechol 2,3-dioxygenase-like lactoylglutathione lyase family enzyme